MDGSPHQERPYTVTEQAYSVKEIMGVLNERLPHIFFPHSVACRTTQWERGDDPMTQFSFRGKYDDFGQLLSQTAVSVPRRSRRRHRLSPIEVADETQVLAIHSRTLYAAPVAGNYIHDRVAHGTSMELTQPPTIRESDPDSVQTVLRDQKEQALSVHAKFEVAFGERPDGKKWQPQDGVPTDYRVFGHTVNLYDGQPYIGLAVGRVGTNGTLTRSETLVFDQYILRDAYLNPTLIDSHGRLVLPAGAPAVFNKELGYEWKANQFGYVDGFYLKAQQCQYNAQGLVIAQRDPLNHETVIAYDSYAVLPESVTDPIKLETTAIYNYRVMQPETVMDANKNIMEFEFSPIGLLMGIWVKGKQNANEGDQAGASTQLSYDFLAYHNSVLIDPANPQPIGVRTVCTVRHDTDPADTGESTETREYSDGFGRLLQTRAQGEDIRFGDTTFGGGAEILPAKQSDGSGGVFTGRRSSDPLSQPHVTVSGWQRYDNKGRVVEKYEPFFDKGWNYDAPADSQLGAKATLYYDPLGRVMRTVNPDGSEQRVIYGIPALLSDPPLAATDTKFSPTSWETYTYDQNDLAAVAYDPISLPGGVRQPLKSRAPKHHYFTPSSIVIDGMGRTLMAIQRNRQGTSTGTTTLSPIEELRTRSTYDIQGNLLTITDPLDREAFRHVYDLNKRVLRIESIDAGVRQMVLNAVGNEVQRRDLKGAISLNAYDVLSRPIELWARDRAGQAITMRERLEYGDGSDPNQSLQKRTAERSKNRLGKLAEHHDEAGLLLFNQYDFKGNLLDKTRRVISDSALAVGWNADWSVANADNDIENRNYVTSQQYDALNRPTRVQYPNETGGNRAVLQPIYNRAGALEQLQLDGEVYVQRIAYNAKGQRVFIAYGNDILTRYAYDPLTFRLARIRTEHVTRAGITYRPSGTLLQDWAYDYDLIGNILAIRDIVPGCGLPNNPNQLDRAFGYDAIYRLISAVGRECNLPTADPYWSDPPRHQDVSKTRRYTQRYTYDESGNMTELAHTATSNGSFTRSFRLAPGNNRLDRVTVGPATPTNVRNYIYDDNGNMTDETTSRQFVWNYADRLGEFRETNGVASSILARYLYDSTGMRVKKWVRRGGIAANDESTIYIDGIFERHRWTKQGGGENNHLHVLDNQNRVTIVRRGRLHPDDRGPVVQYHLGDHLGSSNVMLGGPTATDDNFINREELFPYGETSFGKFGSKRYRFTGKERDQESGLNLHGVRFLALWLVRWTSPDPLGANDGLNVYAYVYNNPITWNDPSGFAGETSSAASSSNDNICHGPDIYYEDGKPVIIIHGNGEFHPGTEQQQNDGGEAPASSKTLQSQENPTPKSDQSGSNQLQKSSGPSFSSLLFTAGSTLGLAGNAFSKAGTSSGTTTVLWAGRRSLDAAMGLAERSGGLYRSLETSKIGLASRAISGFIFKRFGESKLVRDALYHGLWKPVSAVFGLHAGFSGHRLLTLIQTTKTAPYGRILTQIEGPAFRWAQRSIGAFKTLGKRLPVIGLVLSAGALVNDIRKGDAVSGIGSVAGTVSGIAAIAGATSTAAVTGAFALGYGVGTVANELFLGDFVDSFAPGSGSLGDWYYQTILK